MPSVMSVKKRLTIQMRKYSPAEPVNSGRVARSPALAARAGKGPDRAAGAASPLLKYYPPFGSTASRKLRPFYRPRSTHK